MLLNSFAVWPLPAGPRWTMGGERVEQRPERLHDVYRSADHRRERLLLSSDPDAGD